MPYYRPKNFLVNGMLVPWPDDVQGTHKMIRWLQAYTDPNSVRRVPRTGVIYFDSDYGVDMAHPGNMLLIHPDGELQTMSITSFDEIYERNP